MNFICQARARQLDISQVIVFATDQETYDIVSNNWLRNTTPYGLTLDNVSYEFVTEPYKIYDEVIDITSTSVGTIDSVGIITGGSGYQVGDRVIFETLPGATSAKAKVSEVSGKVITKITSKDLDKLQGQSIAEIIGRTVGIEVNGVRSNAGQNLSYFVRGGRNRQVLVMIDGIQVTDPSQIANDYDLRLLNADQVESIEILKGASSTLYGTGAATAVINIKLKEASKNKISAIFSSSLATNNSQDDSRVDIADFTNSIGVNGTLNKFNYLINFSNKFTDGLSAIKALEGENENGSDAFSKIAGNIKLGYQFNDKLSVTTFANFDKYRTGFDESFGFLDGDNISRSEQFRVGVAPKYKYNKGSFQINAAINSIDREFESSFPSQFESQSIVVDAFNKYQFNDNLFTILGVNYVKTEMDSYAIPFGETSFQPDIESETANDEIIDPYANVTYITDFGLNINAGVRLNNHSEYGSNFVYNINPSYNFEINETNTVKVLVSYSTAYITPSLFQLFANGFGNPNLEAQEDATIEAGFELNRNNNLKLSAIYFNRKQDNFIDYVVTDPMTFAGEYQNLSDSRTVSGVEVELNYSPIEKLDVSANYTFTESKDATLFRVPKHKANATVGYTFLQDSYISLSYQYTDDRVSPFFNDDFTGSLRAFRRKKALQLSHDIASKLYPCAKPEQTIFDKTNGIRRLLNVCELLR
mgnify:CR=1 FL=1